MLDGEITRADQPRRASRDEDFSGATRTSNTSRAVDPIVLQDDLSRFFSSQELHGVPRNLDSSFLAYRSAKPGVNPQIERKRHFMQRIVGAIGPEVRLDGQGVRCVGVLKTLYQPSRIGVEKRGMSIFVDPM
jgi:hypothetical protein